MPVRLLLGSGLMLIGIGLLAMTDSRRGLDLDRADPRLHPRRRRRRPRQPAAGLDRDRRGPARSARGWPPGSTRPSARSGSPRASPGWAPSSSTASPRAPRRRCARADRRTRSSAPPTASSGTLLESGEVTQIAHSLSAAARAALDHSYRVGFTEAFTTIALIAAVIALVGAVLAFVLVRSRDFVSAGEAARRAGRRAGAGRGRRGMRHADSPSTVAESLRRRTPSSADVSRHKLRRDRPDRLDWTPLQPAPHTRDSRAPAAGDSADRLDPRASVRTARTSNLACSARPACVCSSRTTRAGPRLGGECRGHGHDRSVVTSATTACNNR